MQLQERLLNLVQNFHFLVEEVEVDGVDLLVGGDGGVKLVGYFLPENVVVVFSQQFVKVVDFQNFFEVPLR